jgi:hypothetical protein
MSNYLALGGVSSTLRTLLDDRMEIPPLPSGITEISITISTPSEDDDTDVPRINLFLYKVTEDVFLKNQEIPGQGHPAAYGHPPLSLELHYLVTAYGNSMEPNQEFANETLAHYLLGSAMRVLHDYPVITGDMTTSGGQRILDLNLQGQFEKVVLCLEPISLDDMSKIWTALTLPYRLSAGYVVSVVQIESQNERRYPQLVGELPEQGPRVQVVTLITPRIIQLLVKRQGTPPDQKSSNIPYARIGDRLDLLGASFNKDDTQIRIGTLLCPPLTAPPLTPQSLSVLIPDDAALQPGAVAVSAVRQVMMGQPPEARPAFESNVAVFMLVPYVTSAVQLAGVVTVNGSRLWQENKDCQVIVGDQVIPAADYTTATSSQIIFPLPALGAGTYPVRVRVNGAESIDAKTVTVP